MIAPFSPRIAAAVIRHLRDGYGVDDAPSRGVATADQARAVMAHLRSHPRVMAGLIRDIQRDLRRRYPADAIGGPLVAGNGFSGVTMAENHSPACTGKNRGSGA